MENNVEIPLEDLQNALFDDKQYYVLSRWIDVLRKAFPTAEIKNYYGSTSGRINGVYYEFVENYFMYGTPKIVKCNPPSRTSFW